MLLDTGFLEKLDQLQLVARRPVAGGWRGERRSRRQGSSVEFADYREYYAGDDYRYVDWNVYSRLDRLFVKLFVAEEHLPVTLLLDHSGSMDFGIPNKLEYARRLTAALGYVALCAGDEVRAMSWSGGVTSQMPPLRARVQYPHLFRWLEQLSPGGQTDFLRAARAATASRRSPGLAILVSDLLEAAHVETGISQLRARGFEVIVLHLLSPEEFRPELDGVFDLVDAETGGRLQITLDGDLIDRYATRLQEWVESLRSFCFRHQAGYVVLDTSVPLEDLLLKHLRAGGLLR